MPKIRKKNNKNHRSVGVSAHQPTLASGGWEFCPHTPALLLSPTIRTSFNSFLL